MGAVNNVAADTMGLLGNVGESDGDSGADQRTATDRERTQAVNTTIERYEDTIDVHHRNSTDVMITDTVSLEDSLIGIFLGLLDGYGDLHILGIGSVQLQDLDKDPHTVLIVGRGIEEPLVAQFIAGDIALDTKHLHENARSDHADNASLGNGTLIKNVIAILTQPGLKQHKECFSHPMIPLNAGDVSSEVMLVKSLHVIPIFIWTEGFEFDKEVRIQSYRLEHILSAD